MVDMVDSNFVNHPNTVLKNDGNDTLNNTNTVIAIKHHRQDTINNDKNSSTREYRFLPTR